MTTLLRDRDRRAQRSRLMLQVLYRQELAESGRRRSAALEEADAELTRVARFLPGALHAGIRLTEISQLTGVSRPTLYSLKDRHIPSTDDEVRYALLSALGGLGPQTAEQLAAVAHINEDRIADIVARLVAEGLLNQLIAYSTPASPTSFLFLTELGAMALEELLTARTTR